MEILNYSSYNEKQILELIPKKLTYKKLVVFPDISKVSWLLPTGIAILTDDVNWREFAISNIGCGMLLCKSNILIKDFNKKQWDKFCINIKENIDNVGDLNKGNHFVNAMVSDRDNYISFLIHTGTHKDINKLHKLLDFPKDFDIEHNRLIHQAKTYRIKIFELLQETFGSMQIILDKNHNFSEKTKDGVIIRRGTVKLEQNELSIIPSHLLGKSALIKAKSTIHNSLNSLCHGTGRLISREDNNIESCYDISRIEDEVYITNIINKKELCFETPENYRSLEECLPRIDSLVDIEDIYSNVAYIGGHL